MKKSYKWGILGPGKIANKWAEGLKLLPGADLHAVGSRDSARASDFAGRHGFERAYGSYKEFAADSEMDIVYIASPHSHHMEHTIMCLENGKSVVCEKAFAINGKEVGTMIKYARKKKLFLMEALWPPFQPYYQYARGIIDKGLVGDILTVRSYFAFKPPYEPEKRLFNSELGGGVLLDIGIYPVIDALRFLGKPDKIDTAASFDRSGVDSDIDILFSYSNGRTASLYSSFNSGIGVGTDLVCEGGIISLRRKSDGSQLCRLKMYEGNIEKEIFNPDAQGYQFEAIEAMKCLDAGKTESDVVPLSFSKDLIDTLDKIRLKAGIIYPDHD